MFALPFFSSFLFVSRIRARACVCVYIYWFMGGLLYPFVVIRPLLTLVNSLPCFLN